MLTKPSAFLSDLHGNLAALQAVLSDLDDRGITEIFVAGDLLLGGEQPLEVWRLLQERKADCVRGSSDTALALMDPSRLTPTTPEERAAAERFATTRKQLGELVLASLRRLPEQRRYPLPDGSELVLTHSALADNAVALSHDLDDDDLVALLGDDPADVFVTGDSHVAFARHVRDVLVVNVGSVGASPDGHAHYTVLTPRADGPPEIEQLWVSLSPPVP